MSKNREESSLGTVPHEVLNGNAASHSLYRVRAEALRSWVDQTEVDSG